MSTFSKQPIADRLVAPKSGSIGVIDAVGNTPLFELSRLAADVAPVRICLKAEWYNPGGSIKDRPALNMILEGQRTGRLTRNKTILDATSGNTGIAYAMIGAALGYGVKLVVPQTIGPLHRKIMLGYGAQLVHSPATEGSDGAFHLCQKIFSEEPDRYFYPDQYNNDANWLAHYHTTAPEIISQTDGRVTHFIAGLGTTGTFTGTSRRLKEFNPDIRVISFQPDSPMHGLEGLRHMPGSHGSSFYDERLADENLWVTTEEAQEMIRQLARREGLLVGLSTGAAAACAMKVARKIDHGLIVIIGCDNAHKYLNQAFWDAAP